MHAREGDRMNDWRCRCGLLMDEHTFSEVWCHALVEEDLRLDELTGFQRNNLLMTRRREREINRIAKDVATA